MTNKINFIAECTISLPVLKETVWDKWANVDGWSEWDKDLEFTKLNGPFAAGSNFSLRPKGVDQTFTVNLTSVTPHKEFADETVLPFGKLRDYHFIEPMGELAKATVKMHFKPLDKASSEMFHQNMWNGMREGIPGGLHIINRLIAKSKSK